MVDVFGPERQVVVARELTKRFEEVVRGTVAEVAAWAEGGVRGEVVVVLAGAPQPSRTPMTGSPRCSARGGRGEAEGRERGGRGSHGPVPQGPLRRGPRLPLIPFRRNSCADGPKFLHNGIAPTESVRRAGVA